MLSELGVRVSLGAAHEHLRFIDPDEPRHTFQVAPDVPGAPRRVYTGKLRHVSQALVAANLRGAGVYVMVNAGDLKGRATSNVHRVRFAFVDLDGAPYREPEHHKAHGVIRTSPGRAHVYWRVTSVPLDAFRPLQRGLARALGGDPSVCDLPRVLRLAGFLHRKRDPFLVSACRLDHDAAPLTLDDVCRAFPEVTEELDLARRPPAPPPVGASKRLWSLDASHRDRLVERLLDSVARKAARLHETGRHHTLLWAARVCLDNRVSESDAVHVTMLARDRLPPRSTGPVPDQEVIEVVRWVYSRLQPGKPWEHHAHPSAAASIIPPGLVERAEGES